jgi:hypothetical protein
MKPSALLFAAAVVFVPALAHAQDHAPWAYRAFGTTDTTSLRSGRIICRDEGHCYRLVRHGPRYRYVRHDGPASVYGYARRYEEPTRVYRYARRYDDPTRVYGYVRRQDEEVSICREIKRVVGDQHLTVEGAKKAANDSWAGSIRFHLGEKFMDLSNARHIIYTCSRSSIKEGGVATLGQTLTRCEVEAQPCSAPRNVEDK